MPSLDVVRAELEIERAVLEKRSDTVDSRAGLVLGSSGVLAGLALNSKSVWALPGALFAAAAAIAAATVFWPRLFNGIKLRALHQRYLTRPEAETKRSVLDTRILDHENNEEQVAEKLRRLKISIRLLVVAVSLVVLALAAALTAKAVSDHKTPGKPAQAARTAPLVDHGE